MHHITSDIVDACNIPDLDNEVFVLEVLESLEIQQNSVILF